jgi:hypothetical protein
MKRLSLYLFLILFTLQTPSLADDISDFQIEGMSIGDSLLDYITEEEINYEAKHPNAFIYKNNKFISITFPGSNSEIYDYLTVTYKPKDKKYIIHEIKGYLRFQNNIKGCLKKKKEIVSELSAIFKEAEKNTKTESHAFDKTGESITHSNWFFIDTGFIGVTCTDWSEKLLKERDFTDDLTINIDSREFEDFLKNKAYK